MWISLSKKYLVLTAMAEEKLCHIIIILVASCFVETLHCASKAGKKFKELSAVK
jgi:hypothetical protein